MKKKKYPMAGVDTGFSSEGVTDFRECAVQDPSEILGAYVDNKGQFNWMKGGDQNIGIAW